MIVARAPWTRSRPFTAPRPRALPGAARAARAGERRVKVVCGDDAGALDVVAAEEGLEDVLLGARVRTATRERDATISDEHERGRASEMSSQVAWRRVHGRGQFEKRRAHRKWPLAALAVISAYTSSDGRTSIMCVLIPM